MYYNGNTFAGKTDDLGHLNAPQVKDASGRIRPILVIRGEMKARGEFADAQEPLQPWVIEETKDGLQVTHCAYRSSADYGAIASRVGVLLLHGWKFA